MSESITATNDKVLRWCQALHDEGLLSEQDLDKCTSQFAQLQQDPVFYSNTNTIDGQSVNTKVASRELGLTAAQIRQATLDPIKYMIDGDHRQTLQIEFDDIHVDPESSALRQRARLEAPSQFNLINRGRKVGVLFQHMDTGRYITLKQLDSTGHNTIAVASLETPDSNSYFHCRSISTSNVSKRRKHRWILESASNPGQALELLDMPIGRLTLTDMTTHGQQLKLTVIKTVIDSNGGRGSNGETDLEFTAESARVQVDDILADINQHRLNYYRLLAVKDYLVGLRDQMRQFVARDGPLMDYYHQTIGNQLYTNKNPQDTQQQLRAISASIQNELENKEIAAINTMIDQIDARAKAYAEGPLATATAKIPRLYTSIDTSVTRRNEQIKQLDAVLDKINRDQKNMTSELQHLDKQSTLDDRRYTVSTTNNIIIKESSQQQKWQYWGAIAMGLLLIICLGIFGRELWYTARYELS